MLIDFHTHKYQNGVIGILMLDWKKPVLPPTDQYFCLGVHPWDCKFFDANRFEATLADYCDHPLFFGLGEIGLDRAKKHDYQRQVNTFEKQIKLACQYNINNLILHNVKSHSDTLQLLKKTGFQGRVILHDYRANKEVFKQYQKICDTYLSLGLSFLKYHTRSIQELPAEKILLETDDQHIHISQIYELYSDITSMDVSTIVKIMENRLQILLSPVLNAKL